MGNAGAGARVKRVCFPNSRAMTLRNAGVMTGARRNVSASTPASVSQSRGKYSRPARASSPTSRAILVSCIATPSSQARARTTAERAPMTTAIMAPTAPATRAA